MRLWASHPLAMLTEIYIEALLVDEELADQVRRSNGGQPIKITQGQGRLNPKLK